MHQTQDPVPLHPHQHEAGAKTTGQVSYPASGTGKNDKAWALSRGVADSTQGKAC